MKRAKKTEKERDINRSMTAGKEESVHKQNLGDCFHIAVGFAKNKDHESAQQCLAPLNLRARRIMAIKPPSVEEAA